MKKRVLRGLTREVDLRVLLLKAVELARIRVVGSLLDFDVSALLRREIDGKGSNETGELRGCWLHGASLLQRFALVMVKGCFLSIAHASVVAKRMPLAMPKNEERTRPARHDPVA